ncbi:MAG: hypothetical protein HZB42_14035 [Sphingobacteriales bacterium]|nr:hypothetical protein [Sphingobacteriales bacterium]
MKDTKTILLALLSIGLVATWVYHIYDKTKYSGSKANTEKQEQNAVKKIQDSLQQVYNTTLYTLGVQLDSAKNTAGLLQGELTVRLDEINQLRTEIAGLLKKSYSRKEDLDLAGRKTSELQQLVAGLPGKTKTGAEEKKTTSQLHPDTQFSSPGGDNTKDNPVSLFTASDLKFTPLTVSDDEKETETNDAEKTNKLSISFTVKNNSTGFNNAEVFAIITEPDGKVMQPDVWEAATINTHDFGKKPYTRKMRFEYQKGELKRLQLTLSPEDYEKGNYRLQVFHNGYLIGETIKTLN